MIIPLKNHEYEMLKLPRVALLYLLLDKYPVLREIAKPVEVKSELVDINTFLQELKEYDGNIMVGEFRDKVMVREQVYYWKDKVMYQYDWNNQLRKGVNSLQVRRELLTLLQISEEVEHYA